MTGAIEKIRVRLEWRFLKLTLLASSVLALAVAALATEGRAWGGA